MAAEGQYLHDDHAGNDDDQQSFVMTANVDCRHAGDNSSMLKVILSSAGAEGHGRAGVGNDDSRAAADDDDDDDDDDDPDEGDDGDDEEDGDG